MSVKLDIFNDIKTAITANVTAITDVLVWNGQIDNEKEEGAKAYPIVYVEFAQISWDKTSLRPVRTGSTGSYQKNEQRGNCNITIHVVFWQLDDETTSFAAIDSTIELAYFAIMGLNGTYYNPLLRTGEKQDVNHDNVIDWQIDFNCGINQTSQSDTSISIPAATLAPVVTSTMSLDNVVIRAGYDT
jgi:hypothetical protein